METEKLLLQRYQVIRKLGKGGFGTTYLVIDSPSGKYCVVKLITLKKYESVKSLDLIKLEGKVMAQLDHPMIPKLIDFFIDETAEKIDVYIVQEYINGKNLLQLMKDGKQFYEKDAIKIALNIAKLLEYLHSFSPPIIHRDIKPENIMFTEDERVYLIDFGAVKEKIISDRASKLGLSTIIGTQGYMPIEQFESRTVPGSDIYALGLTLIYLLSRKEIFKIEKEGLYLNFQPYVNISQEFSIVIENMIEADWKKRYQNADELKNDLLSLFDKNDKKNKRKAKVISEIVRHEINKGEKLRWQGYIETRYKITRIFYVLLLSFVPYAGLFLLLGLGKTLSSISYLYLGILFTFILPFVYIKFKNRSKIIYAITDKRVLVIEIGKVKTVRSFSGNDLSNMIIEAEQNLDSTGNLIFNRRPFSLSHEEESLIIETDYNKISSVKKERKEFEIIGVTNIDLVKRIVMDILPEKKHLNQDKQSDG